MTGFFRRFATNFTEDALRLRYIGPQGWRMWAPCGFLGLDPMRDNVDGLDIGAGRYFQPISFQHELPWPDSDYPNVPYPADEPQDNYPLPPSDEPDPEPESPSP